MQMNGTADAYLGTSWIIWIVKYFNTWLSLLFNLHQQRDKRKKDKPCQGVNGSTVLQITNHCDSETPHGTHFLSDSEHV